MTATVSTLQIQPKNALNANSETLSILVIISYFIISMDKWLCTDEMPSESTTSHSHIPTGRECGQCRHDGNPKQVDIREQI